MAEGRRPHLVVIMADQLRFDVVNRQYMRR